MGRHTPRTAADELRDAQEAIANAQRALRDLRSHVEEIIDSPKDDVEGVARAAKRNTDIAAAELALASNALQTAARMQSQLSSVS